MTQEFQDGIRWDRASVPADRDASSVAYAEAPDERPRLDGEADGRLRLHLGDRAPVQRPGRRPGDLVLQAAALAEPAQEGEPAQIEIPRLLHEHLERAVVSSHRGHRSTPFPP